MSPAAKTVDPRHLLHAAGNMIGMAVSMLAVHTATAEKSVEALEVERSLSACDEPMLLLSEDEFNTAIFGDRYPKIVFSLDQCAAAAAELFGIAERLERLSTQSTIIPEDGVEKWLRNNELPTMADCPGLKLIPGGQSDVVNGDGS